MFSADAGDLTFQVSDTRFAGVMAHYDAQRIISKFDLIGLKTAIFTAAGNQILARDLDLFLFGVSRQFDDLHAVAQSRGNRVEDICGSDEKYARKIERHVQVVITK